MKKLFTNIKILHRVAVIAVIAAMVGATAVSFAFWKSGVSGDVKDKDLGISIGEGLISTGKIVTSAYTNTSGRLIPVQRIHEYAGILGDGTDPSEFVSEITYQFDLAWLTDTSVGNNEYTGQLDIELVSAMIGTYDIKDYDSKVDDLKIFTVTKSYDSTISAQHIDQIPNQLDASHTDIDRTAVTIKIQLNEPKDSATYNLIANSNVKFNFRVSVISDREI